MPEEFPPQINTPEYFPEKKEDEKDKLKDKLKEEPKVKRRVLIVGDDLGRMAHELALKGGEVVGIDQARQDAPTIDFKLLEKEGGDKPPKQKPPRHTKKKGQRY
jgi:hypothetical protein